MLLGHPLDANCLSVPQAVHRRTPQTKETLTMWEFLDGATRDLKRVRDAERFVRLLVVGGIVLVAGLWVSALSGRWSLPWLLGAGLAVGGACALGVGIWSEIDY